MLKCAVGSALLLIPPLGSSTSVQLYQENTSLILQKQIYLRYFFNKNTVSLFLSLHTIPFGMGKDPWQFELHWEVLWVKMFEMVLLLLLYFLIWNWRVALITCTAIIAHRVCAHRCLTLVERRTFPRETQAGSKSRENSGHPEACHSSSGKFSSVPHSYESNLKKYKVIWCVIMVDTVNFWTTIMASYFFCTIDETSLSFIWRFFFLLFIWKWFLIQRTFKNFTSPSDLLPRFSSDPRFSNFSLLLSLLKYQKISVFLINMTNVLSRSSLKHAGKWANY